MHYTGSIWRPPYEWNSLLLEITVGCSHHRCKFCTLYAELPFKFKVTENEIIVADLSEAGRRLKGHKVSRTFLTGANPFVLNHQRLMKIAAQIKRHLPSNRSIGCFARITDIARKSDDELVSLRKAGFDGLTIGMETCDDEALSFMNKGYLSTDILKQCKRLERAGISYSFFYLTGISGSGRGEIGAKLTADVCNQLNPQRICPNMLTIYPNSELYKEIQRGTWKEESELEKYKELRALVKHLTTPALFETLGASNLFYLRGHLARDKGKLLKALDKIIDEASEDELRRYRKNLRHL